MLFYLWAAKFGKSLMSLKVFLLPHVYLQDRFFDPKTVYVKKYFNYIILLTIAAGAVLLIEVAAQSPLQFHSGYFDYSYLFLSSRFG